MMYVWAAGFARDPEIVDDLIDVYEVTIEQEVNDEIVGGLTYIIP